MVSTNFVYFYYNKYIKINITFLFQVNIDKPIHWKCYYMETVIVGSSILMVQDVKNQLIIINQDS